MCLFAVGGCIPLGSEQAHHRSQIDSSNPVGQLRVQSAALDDLAWLVGKWRCVAKRWFVDPNKFGGSHSEDRLEYFNVYLPYGDDQLTLKLTDNPDDRLIAAELLVKEEDHPPYASGRLVPMYPNGPVWIGKQRIRLGQLWDLFDRYEFKYSLVQGATMPRLKLQSRFMELEFERVSKHPGDLRKAYVFAPVRDYSDEKLRELQHAYERLSSGRIERKTKE